MKKYKLILLSLLIVASSAMKANEGMWLISLLNRMNEAEMNKMGLHLTPEEIYSINKACLKDAIVRLNGGSCTGEVVSDKGLVFTNHHCAYDAIQSLSTVQNDMLTNGFVAKSIQEELPIPGFEISFLVRVEDVTKAVLEGVNDGMSQEERDIAVDMKIKELIQKNNGNGQYLVDLKSFFYGNEYYMFIYESFRDIRLVGNPPESVGKFGGDTDNWMWPRHTGDFSMLRIYASTENKPADYSASNVPYKPKHFLPVCIDGVKEGDYAMVLGYPGSTDRFLSSWGVKQALEISNPSTVEVRDLKLKTMKEHMDADPAVRLKYAAKYAQTANYWKYFIGQDKGLVRLNVYEKKKKIEDDFSKWVNQGDEARKKKYGNALNLIADYYKATDASAKSNTYISECALQGSDLVLFAWRFVRTYERSLKETDEAKRAAMLKGFTPTMDEFYRDFDLATEKDLFVRMTSLYMKNIAPENWPMWMADIQKKFKGNVAAYAEKLYETTIFVDRTKLEAFINKPVQKVYDKDMAVAMAKTTIEKYRATFINPDQAKFDEGYRLFVAGLREMNPNKTFAPDANSTMRLTYGTVRDYYPADAVHYDYYTTTKGIMEKRDNSNPEFVVPDKLAELIAKKDFGRYANSDGELVTCFIGNLDITGGNSGSPVIDGYGNLIGLAFDGNWEAMSGDIAFEPELQRTIAVDVRYVLFIVEKLMGGKNIIDELKIAKRPAKPVQTVKPEGEPLGTSLPASVTTPSTTAPAGVQMTPEMKKKIEDAQKQRQEEIKMKQEEIKKRSEENKMKQEEMKKKADESRKKAQEVNKVNGQTPKKESTGAKPKPASATPPKP